MIVNPVIIIKNTHRGVLDHGIKVPESGDGVVVGLEIAYAVGPAENIGKAPFLRSRKSSVCLAAMVSKPRLPLEKK